MIPVDFESHASPSIYRRPRPARDAIVSLEFGIANHQLVPCFRRSCRRPRTGISATLSAPNLLPWTLQHPSNQRISSRQKAWLWLLLAAAVVRQPSFELPHHAPRLDVSLNVCKQKRLTITGLDLAIASTLYQNGAEKIYILGRRHDVLLKAVQKLQSDVPSEPNTSTSVKEVVCDVTDLNSVKAAAEFIKNDAGYVDVLINNAGVIGPKNSQEIYRAQTIQEVSDSMVLGWDGWQSAMAINTQSVIGVSATFLPLLEAANTRRGWAPGKVTGTANARARDTLNLSANNIAPDDDRMAHIITIASVASFNRWISAGLAYSATKSAAAHLGKMMSTFLAEWGIRSNIICPGPYPSDMTAGNNPVFGTNQVPQGRMGGINDVAGLMLFLVGKGGAYVNGCVQLSDGGRVGVFPGTY